MKTKNDGVYETNTNGDAIAKASSGVHHNDIPSKKTILEQVVMLDNELLRRCRVFTWINWPLPLTGQQADWQRELRMLVDECDKLATQYLAVQDSCTVAQRKCRKLADKFIKNVSKPHIKRRRMEIQCEEIIRQLKARLRQEERQLQKVRLAQKSKNLSGKQKVDHQCEDQFPEERLPRQAAAQWD